MIAPGSRSTGPRRRAEGGTLPQAIWTLGFVSLCMDISSEMIHALLPVFLTAVLGASALTVGLIEGIGEATAALVKPLSGWLSDRLGRRKALAVAGYALGALSKPLFALAPTVAWVLLARFSDRIGKGIRGAPRDALVGDLAPRRLRGRAYGLRQALDTVGAFAGPLLAMALMALSANDFRLIFWVAAVPGLLAVILLTVGVREPERNPAPSTAPLPLEHGAAASLGSAFWGIALIGTVLTLARFSEAFLILRARDLGLPLALTPLVLMAMSLVYALSAYPAGALADRMDRRRILAVGCAVLIAADISLALASGLVVAFFGICLWGLHMGLTQGLLAALIADTAPTAHRGTAFGLFHLITGLAVLAASLVAGALWEWVGPSATFIMGAMLTAAALVGLKPFPRCDRGDR